MVALFPLVVEQVAVVSGLLAYMTGLVTVRPRPAPGHDTQAQYSLESQNNASVAMVEKTVLVVIDALRADHLVSTPVPLMPYLHTLLANGEAQGYVLHTSSPTVTLPRIKSLVTGSIPGFMDVIENFGAGELVDDSIIRRWVAQGRRIHFYGDDTWLKLFPNHFWQYQGVTSFFVSDYTEVDHNVTHHTSKILTSGDWDVLILHYLGLDHIGHLEGPMSSLIGPKLQEMDSVVKNIHNTLQAKGWKYLLVVCGDHGMSDAGGHGGSTHSEVTTSALFLSSTFSRNKMRKVRDAKQVDLASTLALLTGIGVPEGSVGQPLTEVFADIPVEKRMLFQQQSARQLLAIAKGSGLQPHHGNAELLFDEAMRLHNSVLQDLRRDPHNLEHTKTEAERVCKFYQECQQKASQVLTARLQSYDLPTIYLATAVLIMMLGVCLLREYKGGTVVSKRQVTGVIVCWGAGCSLLGWLLVCAAASGSKLCYLLHPSAWLLAVAFIYVMVTLAVSSSRVLLKPSQKTGSKDALHYFLLLGTVFHSLSLLATSLVEEEHQTVYFLTTTLHIYLILKIVIHNLQSSHTSQGQRFDDYNANMEEDGAMLPTKVKQGRRKAPSVLEKVYLPQNKMLVLLVLSLVLTRIMRAWNATGDKWRHLEDLGDIIRAVGGKVVTLVVVIGLVLSLLLFLHTFWPLVFITLAATYGRHFPFFGNDFTSGKFEAQLAYLAIFLLYIYGLFKAKLVDFRGQNKPQKLVDAYELEEDKISTLLQYSYTALSLLCLLLQRVDNVGLLSLVLLQNWMLSHVFYRLALAKYMSWEGVALAVDWLAFTHFFNQGNSNNLTTIDVSAGFVGVGSYHPLLHGVLIATQTFGGTFLTYLAHLTHLASRDGSKERWQKQLYVWWCVRLATVTLYLVNVTWQRHHLFIWSVFIPKLLYEGAHVLVLCALSLFMWGVEKVCTLLEVTYRFE